MLSIQHRLAQYTLTCTTGMECSWITQNGIRYLYARTANDADTGLWPGTCQRLMINMSIPLVFYTYHFIYFIILIFLNYLILGIALPRYMYWCCTPLYLLFLEDAASKPNYIKSYLKLMYSL